MRNRNLVLALAGFLVSFVVGCGSDPSDNVNATAPKGTGFQQKSISFNGDTRHYAVFVPFNYTAAKKYPTIIFLHGIGETGNDGHKCLTVGLGPSIAKRAG